MRKWVELFDEPRPSFEVLAISELPRVICRCIELLALFWQERVKHTVKWRCILSTRGYLKKLTKAYTLCNTFTFILHAYPRFLSQGGVHTINSPMLFLAIV